MSRSSDDDARGRACHAANASGDGDSCLMIGIVGMISFKSVTSCSDPFTVGSLVHSSRLGRSVPSMGYSGNAGGEWSGGDWGGGVLLG